MRERSQLETYSPPDFRVNFYLSIIDNDQEISGKQ
jgi:hypothetical protein